MENIAELFAGVSVLDISIIALFLLLNLFIGIYFSRGISNVKEYALGNRNFSTATIVATIVATWIGGSTFPAMVSETYKDGLYFIMPLIADALSLGVIAYFYAPRMQELLGKLSVADAMGDIYGNKARAATAIIGAMLAIGKVAMQFIILTTLLTNFIGMSGFYAVLLSGMVVITYSTFGGIKAITFTDVIQFFTFGVVIPMTAFLIWSSVDNNALSLLNVLQTHPVFDMSQVFDINNPKFTASMFFFVLCIIPALDPAIFQRVSMARHARQAVRAFTIAGLILLACYIIFFFVGILLMADTATLPENVSDSHTLLRYIINHFMSTGFKGAFVVGILAMSMSTADSYINAATILLSYDLPKSMGINISEKRALVCARLAACTIGISGLALSLFFKSTQKIMFLAYSFYMPVVTVPLVLAIFGFRSSGLSCLLGMFSGFVTVCVFKFCTDIDNLAVPGMLANIIVYMGSHYMLRQPGGWVGIKDKATFMLIQQERKAAFSEYISTIKNFSITRYLDKTAFRQESTYVFLGLFCVVATFVSLYSLPKMITDQHTTLVRVISYTTLFFSTILISYPAWVEKFKSPMFMSLVSHITIFVVRVIGGSFIVLISHFDQLQIVILTAGLITSAILLRWHTTLIFIIVGMVTTGVFYKQYADSNLVFENITMEFSVMYIILMASAISIVFLKPKEDALEISEARSDDLWNKINEMEQEVQKANNVKTEFLNNISHEVRTPMTGITSLGQALWDNYDHLSEEKRKECVHTIAKSSDRLISLMNNILDLSALTSLNFALNITKVNLSILIKDSIKKCRKIYLGDKFLQFDIKVDNELYAKCDQYYIGHTIDNLIINAINYSRPGTTIYISLKQKGDNLEFAIRDEGIGIPKEELFDIFRPFTVSSKTRTPAGGRGVGLALCYGAITAHNGRIWAESDGKGAEFKFII